MSGHIDQLEQLLATNPTASDTDAKLVLTRVLGEIQHRQVSAAIASSDFFFGVLRTISRIRGSSNSSLRMSCLWESGKFFDMHGLYGPAFEAADQLEELARRSNDTTWLRKSYTFGGIVHAEFGNVAEAVVRHAKSFDLAATESTAIQIVVLANTAVALNYAGLHQEAIQCCQRAVEISRGQTDRPSYDNSAVALCNMALGYLYLEQFPAGLEAIRECLARTAEPEEGRSALSRVIREWTF